MASDDLTAEELAEIQAEVDAEIEENGIPDEEELLEEINEVNSELGED